MNKIVVVIDKSGSMGFLRNDVIGGFNSFLEEQQKLGDDAVMTVVQFDDQYEVYAENVNIKDVQPLNQDNYVPRGTTSLLDALGKTITSTLARRSTDKVLFFVMTDGQENSSVEYKKDKIQKMIEEKKQSGWEFVFFSSDLNGINDAKEYGFTTNLVFNSDFEGVKDTYSMMNTMSTNFRGYGDKDNENNHV